MTTISLQEFIEQNRQKKGRVSKLMPFKDDILFLKQNGYSQQQILDFLSQNGLTVGMTTLNTFIRRHGSMSANNSAGDTQQPEAVTPSQENITMPKQPKPPLKKGIKKFDWKNASTEGLI